MSQDDDYDDRRDPWCSRKAPPWGMEWWTPGLVVVLLLVLLLATCAGCASTPEWTEPPRLSCEPLPVCDIPPKATSTQLELALWDCLLEYRAQYSACAARAQGLSPPADTARESTEAAKEAKP